MCMILPSDIDTLDNFKRQTKREIQKLKRSGRPKVLTVNGKPTVVVQDAAAYESQMHQLDYLDCVEAVREGAADIDAGRAVDAATYFKSLSRRMTKKVRR